MSYQKEELFSGNDPAQDAADFIKFQQATQASDARADADAAQTAVRDAARVIADRARVKGIVDAMVNVGLVENIRDYYQYNQQSPGVQAVIDRYIINPGISNAPSGKPPYFPMTHSVVQTQQKQQGNEGGYKSKSKTKSKSKSMKYRKRKSNRLTRRT